METMAKDIMGASSHGCYALNTRCLQGEPQSTVECKSPRTPNWSPAKLYKGKQLFLCAVSAAAHPTANCFYREKHKHEKRVNANWLQRAAG